MTVLAVLTIPGAFDDELRNATVLVGFLILLWLPTVPVPRALHWITGLLASASLYAYVTHWLVYPPFDQASKGLAVVASLAVGIAYWAVATRVMGASERWLRTRLATRRHRRQAAFGAALDERDRSPAASMRE